MVGKSEKEIKIDVVTSYNLITKHSLFFLKLQILFNDNLPNKSVTIQVALKSCICVNIMLNVSALFTVWYSSYYYTAATSSSLTIVSGIIDI